MASKSNCTYSISSNTSSNLTTYKQFLGERRSCLEKSGEGSGNIQTPTIALFCFIFKALFSRKFMPSSSSSESDSEWESFAELSEGFGGAAFVLAALRVFRAGNFIATLRGPEGRH